ncbi:hypothetical protein ACFPRL_34185 [Pseudoclavibacter helvolus]
MISLRRCSPRSAVTSLASVIRDILRSSCTATASLCPICRPSLGGNEYREHCAAKCSRTWRNSVEVTRATC